MAAIPWTTEEEMVVEELLCRGYTDAAIGRRLGRTPVAVKIRRKRHGLGSVWSRSLNARSVGRMLGVHEKLPGRWVEMGLLRGTRLGVGAGKHRRWFFEEHDVLAALADPRTWPGWEPSRIPDPMLREWAEEVRRERYVPIGEVAKRYHVTSAAAHQWVQRGELPALRYGNHYIPESALAGFVPPCERPRPGGPVRRFTAAEDGRLWLLRTAGWTWLAIAAELGRTAGTVQNRWVRLQRQEAQ